MTGAGPRAFAIVAGLLAALTGPAAGALAQPVAAPAGSPAAAPRTNAAQRVAAPPAAPAPPEQPDISVRTHLDRTAVWVADRLTYTVAITCTNGLDIVVDDLARDKLKLEGLEIAGSDSSRSAEGDDVTRYEFRYVLTTYRSDLPILKIAPLTARYYVKRAGQRSPDTAAAGTVVVPAATVTFRSLLPDEQPFPVRDGRPAGARPLVYRALQPVGLGLMILSLVPVAFAAIAVARRVRRRRQPATDRSPRQAQQEVRSMLAVVRAVDPASAEARRQGFRQLDTLVRQHVRDVSDVRAPSLTPAEVAAALDAAAPRMPVELMTSVLTTCELARYAPDRLPSADAWRETLAQAEQILAIGR